MARPNGVVIASERFWAFAGRDGSLREGSMPRQSGLLRRVPLARGLVRLLVSISPLFRGNGIARRRERTLLAGALLLPLGFVFLPEGVTLAAGIGLTVTLLAWLLRGRTLFLHGAEHRAIAAAEDGRLAETWHGRARPSRFSPRCGTNFAALALPLTLTADQLWPLTPAFYTPLAVTLVSLALSMELWRAVQSSTRGALRLLLLPGLGLQRLTTREPTLAETRIALRAVASVARRELA